MRLVGAGMMFQIDKSSLSPTKMEKFIHLRFHHQGEFQSTRYAGGIETVVMGVDTDIFSYTVLMEHVKDDLEYSEIGGIYVSTEKFKNWKLVTNDSDQNPLVERANNGDHINFYVDNVIDINVEPIKQMQPHVVIRPRHNLLAAKKTSEAPVCYSSSTTTATKEQQSKARGFTEAATRRYPKFATDE